MYEDTDWNNSSIPDRRIEQKWRPFLEDINFSISIIIKPRIFSGTLQNYARRAGISIDIISFDFEVVKQPAEELTEKPEAGCYITGLFLEGT